jgi:hypothetical protein
MTNLEDQLVVALKLLTQSADKYIDDGSWIEVLTKDLKDAKLAIQSYHQEKKNVRRN